MTEAPGRPWLVLAGLALGVTVTNGFARFAYGLILPSMQSDLGWNYTQAGWLNTANALGYVLGAFVTMGLVRRYAGARLFAFGVWTTALTLLATGFYEALWAQTLFRVLAGVFGAVSFVTGGALAAALFPGRARQTALAIAIYFGVGGGLGIVISGAVIPPLLAGLGPGSWTWGWIAIGAMSLVFTPPSLWAARQLHPPLGSTPPTAHVPIGRMLGQFGGYAGFGLGYIVYFTFIAAWLTAQASGPALIAGVWVLTGCGIVISPFLWRSVFARFDSGLPLAMILTCIAVGSALPVLVPTLPGLVISAVIFGLAVFMSPGAVTNFIQKNLPQDSWSDAISRFTVVFAVAQTIGPIGAGLVGDAAGDIGVSLLAAAGVLLAGAFCALAQRPLRGAG